MTRFICLWMAVLCLLLFPFFLRETALAQTTEATAPTTSTPPALPPAQEASLDDGALAPLSEEEIMQADAVTDEVVDDVSLSIESKLKKVFRQYSTLGASVAVIENGETTHTWCYGTRRIGGEPVTPDTGFQVGSIGKMVANIGLMQLLEREGLSLETELGDVLGFPIRNPAYPNTAVTLRQLMTHTAGLRTNSDYEDALRGNPLPLNQLFSGARLDRMFFQGIEPGLKREYSNFGGGLLGSLIERLSGQMLDDYMAQNVFSPLGITAAYQAALLPKTMPLADMFRMPQKYLAKELRADSTYLTGPDYLRHYYLTAGKLIITAPDLAKLVIALCDGGVYRDTRLLRESTVAEMATRQNYRGSVACESGHGLFLNIITDDQVEGRTMIGHGGKAYGMLCAAYFDPTDRTGVVMLTNGCRNHSAHNGVGMLGRAVMRICYNDLLSPAHMTEDPFLVGE